MVKLIPLIKLNYFIRESDIGCGGVRDNASADEEVPEASMVDICKEYLHLCPIPACSLEGVNNSYAYKCAVQRWVEPMRGEYTFIQNGAFIVAALRIGWSAVQECEGSPNCVFNFEWEH